MDSLKVVVDDENNLISVYNNGDGVPVEIHKEEGIYVPELIFGHLLTSSNYDDTVKKTTGGRNGFGAKLTNIFSTEFVIETADGKRQKKYKQIFTNNMGKKGDPIISKCKEGENWTKVTFKPDLEKFSMSELEEDVVALMKKRVVDMAGCLGKTVKVELNGTRVPVKSFQDYVNLYINSVSENGMNRPPSFYEKVGERWEVCVSLTEGQFQQVSFVNSIATIKGGTHVDYVTNQIANHVMETVNKKNKNANIRPHNVRNYLWVFVNSLIDNPAFDSQTKETLTLRQSSFGSKCELSDEFLKKVAKSDIVKSLLSWAEFRMSKELKRTDGSKSAKVNVPKLEDANEAGGKNSDKCTLILTEGDSAKALAMSGVAGLSQSDRNYYGVFPLRGKLLNVREATSKQLNENKEIESIKKILGLRHDKQYDNAKSLRYGHLMIMTDQDHDGSHIKGLLINFFHSFWPSLLRVPSFLVEFITPIVKATHRNGTVISFYSMPEYEEWKENLGGNASGWSVKYYKGLGTSTSKEGKEYFGDLHKHKKDFIWIDEQDGDAIELAFSKKKIEARKNWLRQFEPGTYLDQKKRLIKYSDFINKELILFSMADLQRSIPSMVDGLKPGQRKILFCAFKRNLVKEIKVAQFTGYVSENSAYHHGEQSLTSTIIGLAQDFVGSNNINLFKPNGQFGTRNMGGKDHASARYIFTQLSPVTRFLFPKDDDPLLDYLDEDGQSIEPNWYMPIIPMVLVNGSEGIGTGWSTFVPNYNPRDIVANIRRLLNNEPMEPMHPWYRGFRGTVEKIPSNETSYSINGTIEEMNETTVKITELPIRRWTDDYRGFLNSVTEGTRDENGNPFKSTFIKDFKKYGDDTTVDFEVFLSEENLMKAKEEGLLKKFKLSTSSSINNMHLFSPKGVIKKYDSPEQILEEFFHLRFEYYEKRKKFRLENLEKELVKLGNKVRFILGVVSGEIIVNNRKRAELFMELHQKGFTPFPKKKSLEEAVTAESDETEDADSSEATIAAGVRASDYDYLLSMAIGTLTLEKVKQLCADKDKLEMEVEALRNTTPRNLWLSDLDALEEQLQVLDNMDADAEEERIRLKKGIRDRNGANGTKKTTKPPRNQNKKKANKPAETVEATTIGIDPPPLPPVIALNDNDEEEDVESLRDRLNAYRLNDSPEKSAEPEAPKDKEIKAAKTRKKKTQEVLSSQSDEDDEMMLNDLSDDDSDVVMVPKPRGRQKRGGEVAKASKPLGKKRGQQGKQAPSLGQKTITEILKQADVGASPEKKMRRMRESPFNKKSGSVIDKSEAVSSSEMQSTTTGEESAELPVRIRPQRARKERKYVMSESESETDPGFSDSDFDEEEDDED